jgi:hypothetical protein
MMRPLALLAFLLTAALALAGPASAAEWRSEQPQQSDGSRTWIGEVGDVECWQANRCLLITAGNGGVPAGLFAYDGTGWHRYSTVCGGHEGRIAWAGPTEFWTISDQQAGQETGKGPPQHISLCHFSDGKVVASYGEPLGLQTSYLPMDAAACNGPGDCWFAGERLPGTVNEGAFHLHWDGGSLTAIPSLTDPQPGLLDPSRSVSGLALHQGSFYEGVTLRGGGFPVPKEEELGPSFVHRIVPGGATPFEPLFTSEPIVYGEPEAEATELEGFRLRSDGQRLWAVSGAGSFLARMTVLQLDAGELVQLPLVDPEGVFDFGDWLGGVATEPAGGGAWIAFGHENEQVEPATLARLAHVEVDGTVDSPSVLPAPDEPIGHKGPAGPVACAAAEQCWMATKLGWLFHLGPDLPQDTDPAMHVLIDFRPPDHSLPSVPPIGLPEDDSGASSPFEHTSEGEGALGEGEKVRRTPALVSHVHQRLIGKTLLELSFVLREKAHVQLVAKRAGAIVARTPRYTMAKGQRSVRLRLDPDRWPTKLDLLAHALKKKGGK